MPKLPNICPVEGIFKKTGEEKGRDSERNFTGIKSVILAEILCKQAHCQIIIYYRVISHRQPLHFHILFTPKMQCENNNEFPCCTSQSHLLRLFFTTYCIVSIPDHTQWFQRKDYLLKRHLLMILFMVMNNEPPQ